MKLETCNAELEKEGTNGKTLSHEYMILNQLKQHQLGQVYLADHPRKNARAGDSQHVHVPQSSKIAFAQALVWYNSRQRRCHSVCFYSNLVYILSVAYQLVNCNSCIFDCLTWFVLCLVDHEPDGLRSSVPSQYYCTRLLWSWFQ